MTTLKKFLFLTLLIFFIHPMLSFAQQTEADCQSTQTWDGTVCVDNGVDITQGSNNITPTGQGGNNTLIPSGSNGGLVPSCSVDPVTNQCTWGFKEFMTLINTVIQFILFGMAVPIAAIMFAYAGFLMVTSGGSSESKTKAKHIFTNVALGLIIAIAAFVIIRTILSIVGFDGSWIGFK